MLGPHIFGLIAEALGYLTLASLGVGAVGTISWWVFRTLSGKWLDAKFAERLADYKHLQTLHAERVKSDLAAMLDRTTRVHTQEFEILPEAWALLAKSIGSAAGVVSPFQQKPGVQFMNDDELEVALTHQPFKEHEKNEIRAISGKARQERYEALYDRYRWWSAFNDHREYHNYVILKSVFIEPDLRAPFKNLSDAIFDALTFYEVHAFEIGEPMKVAQYRELREIWSKVQPLRDALMDQLGARFWPVKSQHIDPA